MTPDPGALSLHTTMSLLTMARACLDPSATRRPPPPADFARLTPAFTACARALYAVSAASEPLPPQTAVVTLTAEEDVDLRVSYPRPTRSPLVLDAVGIRHLAPRAGVVLTVTGARTFLGQKLLRPDDTRFEVPITPDAEALGTPPLPSFGRYLRLGVEHILTGADHLLFLLGLLVVCRRLRTVAQIVTCFTAAHSLTLALAALHVVAAPPRLVEPLIAATIVAVAVENLSRPHEPDRLWTGRLVTALVFGLIHGLGFAGALAQTGLGAPGASIVPPLVAFNLGVELGQLAVASLILTALWAARRAGWFTQRIPQITSVVVGAIGLFWLVERLR
ncbi:MAG TPA: HupE/UreJ family protein [Polyangia bacterium]|nr:HupE/UreJ family protein [Polyangia bacterium]